MLEQRNGTGTTPVMAVVVDPYIVRYYQHCFHWAWIQEQAIFALNVIIADIDKKPIYTSRRPYREDVYNGHIKYVNITQSIQ
jgi:hypothetical protein